jgi:hypothetical protein
MWRVAAVAAIVTASITGAILIEQDIAASNRSHQNFQQQIDALNNDINALAHGLHVVLPEPLPTTEPAGATHGRTSPSPHATSRPVSASPTAAHRTTPQPTPAARPTTTPVACLVIVCVG